MLASVMPESLPGKQICRSLSCPLSVCLSISQSVCLSAWEADLQVTVLPFVCPSVCLYVLLCGLSLYPSACLKTCLSAGCLSVCLSVCLTTSVQQMKGPALLHFLIAAERDACPEVLACLQSEFARRMEKGEHDFKYKVDQVQESLADAHKAHLRQVCPSLPFDFHTLPFDTHALPSAYPSLPTGCPCCASCALCHSCLSTLTPCLLHTHLCPLHAPAVPAVPCGSPMFDPFRMPALGVHLRLSHQNTT